VGFFMQDSQKERTPLGALSRKMTRMSG